jgi:phage-related protein
LRAYTVNTLAAAAAEWALLSPLLPIVAVLGALVGVGALVVGVLGNMEGVTSGLGATLQVLKDVTVGFLDLLLTVWVAAWNAAITVVMGTVKAIDSLLSAAIDFLPFTEKIKQGIDDISSAFGELFDFFGNLPSLASSAFDEVAKAIEEFINAWPDWLKSAVGIEGEFSFQAPGEGITVSKSDVVSGAEQTGSAIGQLTGTQATQFNYTEENVNEYAQEINADPEDMESLRRVVKDAMEEADSLARRQQGGV